MNQPAYRQALIEYIRTQAKPPDKFSHQPRLYRLAQQLAGGQAYDDEVLFAGVWLHDLGVFIGHRPEDAAALAVWDHVAYAMQQAPGVLKKSGFPAGKIAAVVEIIRTHLPSRKPTCFEGQLLRDADLLEQMGATGVLRVVGKVGRDTRFVSLGDALKTLQRNAESLQAQLKLSSALPLAEKRLNILRVFLEAAEAEAGGVPW
ncbi:MAG TPA: phosphohydrolase [Candidatus Binatia bacterium]|jgi:uncharacterized protein|nr:phosphohydrolase [Candidatus Binatia bacterium]